MKPMRPDSSPTLPRPALLLALAASLLTLPLAPAAARGQAAEAGQPGPEHERLGALVGDWQVFLRGPGGVDEADEASEPAGGASARLRLNGRFLEVELHAQSGPIRHALYTFGFDRRNDRYQVVAMDDTGTYFVTAQGEEADGRVPMYGSDDDPMMRSMGFEKEFAIVLHLHSKDRFVIETRLIDNRTPERKEIPFLAYDLRRDQ